MHRFAFDLGTGSIGWAVLELDKDGTPCRLIDAGVRIFDPGREPKSNESHAVARRKARQARRMRDRKLRRLRDLRKALGELGMFPVTDDGGAFQRLDPYACRARALDEVLTPLEVGRAIYHLARRRGFKSNRKTDRVGQTRKDDNGRSPKEEQAALARAIEESGARTLGEYLYRRHRKREPTRARPGANLYPTRRMVEKELTAILEAQRRHHSVLTDDVCERIRRIVLRQRPLRPPQVGRCALDPDQPRAPKALPSFQLFRILQDLSHLRIQSPDGRERALTPEEYEKLLTKLERGSNVTFNGARKSLKLSEEETFNLEDSVKSLKGSETAAAIRKALGKPYMKTWLALTLEEQDARIEALLDAEDEADLEQIAQETWELDPGAGERLGAVALPTGYGRLGKTTMHKLIPHMKTGLTYADAARAAGFHHSDHRPDRVLDRLPYYGRLLSRQIGTGTGDPNDPEEERWGRVTNPSVHIGLNQLRKVVNALLETYGHPQSVVVELTRDLKLGPNRIKELRRQQEANRKVNEEADEHLRQNGLPINADNRLRYRLWKEQAVDGVTRCIYSGKVIGLHQLFTGQVEVDHILPMSRTLDDSPANKVVCFADANREKGNRSPHEAFGHSPKGYQWEDIVARSKYLNPNKKWRFLPDAMTRFDEEGGFLARQLTDTAYFSRLAKEYLSWICDPNQVWCVSGRLTAQIRRAFGLDTLLSEGDFKNRDDHRQHAIDAVVVGCTDRGLVQRAARAAEREQFDRLSRALTPPWPMLRDELAERLSTMVVSHRVNHSTNGCLFDDTAYGPPRPGDPPDSVRIHKDLAQIRENEVRRHIVDPTLAAILQRELLGKPQKERQQAAQRIKDRLGIRRIELRLPRDGTVPIRDRAGREYKRLNPSEVAWIDLYETPDGKWVGCPVRLHEARAIAVGKLRDARPACIHPASRKIMRVRKGDSVILETEQGSQVYLVHRLQPSANRFLLAEAFQGGQLDSRHNATEDPFRWVMQRFSKLKHRGLRLVSVDVLGRVRDRGRRRCIAVPSK